VMIGSALRVLCASVILAIAPTPVDWSSQATAAETESGIVELITHPKSSADHQKLIKWYEQREDEVRQQAEFYRKLAQDYQGYRAATMTTAC